MNEANLLYFCIHQFYSDFFYYFCPSDKSNIFSVLGTGILSTFLLGESLISDKIHKRCVLSVIYNDKEKIRNIYKFNLFGFIKKWNREEKKNYFSFLYSFFISQADIVYLSCESMCVWKYLLGIFIYAW